MSRIQILDHYKKLGTFWKLNQVSQSIVEKPIKNSRGEICGYGFQWFCPGGWLTKEYSVLMCEHCGIRIVSLLQKDTLLKNSKTSRCRFTRIRNCPDCQLTSAPIGEKYKRHMISLLLRQISFSCFAGIRQGQDQNY